MNAPIAPENLARPARYHWTTVEDAALRRVYPTAGPEACRAEIPGRSLAAIYQRARSIGLSAPATSGGRRSWVWSESELAELRRVYQSRPDRGAINALARRLGKPRYIITRRALTEGLSVPRFAIAPWAPEDALLRQHTHLGAKAIERRLARAGYRRSATAIEVRRKRLQLDTSDPDHFTAHALARCLGVDGKTVTRWIEREGLPAKRRGTARSDAQGGDHWWINRRALRTWIASHAVLVDLRKVDRFWFLDLAFGSAA